MDRWVAAILAQDGAVREGVRRAAETEGLALRIFDSGAEAAASRGVPSVLVVDEALRDSGVFFAVEVFRARGTGIVAIRAPDGQGRIPHAPRVSRNGVAGLLGPHLRTALPLRDPDAPRHLVLLVDDEQNVQDLYRIRLEQAGMRVVACFRVQDALALAQEAPPDVVATDVHLGDGDGFQLCWDLRQDRRTAHIPVVIYSAAWPATEVRDRAEAAGAAQFVQRGQDGQQLVDTIREVASRGPRPRLLPAEPPPEPTPVPRPPSGDRGAAAPMDLLERTTRVILQDSPLQTALARVLQVLAEGPVGFAALYLLDADGEYRERATAGAFSGRWQVVPRVRDLAPFIEAALRQRAPRVLWGPGRPIEDAVVRIYQRCEAGSAVLLPLVVANEPLGALLAVSDLRNLADPRWLVSLGAVASQLALGITVMATASGPVPPPATATPERPRSRRAPRRMQENLEGLVTLVHTLGRPEGPGGRGEAWLRRAAGRRVVEPHELNEVVLDALRATNRGDLVVALEPRPLPVLAHRGLLAGAFELVFGWLQAGGLVRTCGAAGPQVQVSPGRQPPPPDELALAIAIVRAHHGDLRPGPHAGAWRIDLPVPPPTA